MSIPHWDTLAVNNFPCRQQVSQGIHGTSTPPSGPTPFIEGPGFIVEPGDIIDASWSNVGGSSGFDILVSWEVNGSVAQDNQRPPNSEFDSFNTTGLSTGDVVRCRIHYFTTGLIGSGIEFDARIRNGDYYNSRLNQITNLVANRWPRKNELISAADNTGSFGSYSNTITLQ